MSVVAAIACYPSLVWPPRNFTIIFTCARVNNLMGEYRRVLLEYGNE
jgi:hypothetical protein